LQALFEGGGVLRVAGDSQQQQAKWLARGELRIRQPLPKRGSIELRLCRPQRGIRRGLELGVREVGRQGLRVVEMGNDKRDSGTPLLRGHVRSPLSSPERAQPVRLSAVDRTEDDPRRQRVVTHEQQGLCVRRRRVG